jgi:signal transduction histidine kinase
VNSVIDRSVQLRNAAVVSALVVAVAVLLLLGLALLFTVVVARSMVRPLRRLRAGALEVAGVRLPETVRRMSESEGAAAPLEVEPIDVDSSDEIGEVARAFDQVHREALRLASNEAALRGNVNAMFVNLSRRSQSLVERQIRLIDDLEQGEQDAERLANLFQMDHLATRMRRNSENLLVLAGHEVSRRWTQAVPLVDVLRAAVSEIEQYERVQLNVQPGISVRGQAVNDVVHLIAELAENASSFSAADTPVKVSGHLLNSGGVLLDITDQGVGMGAEEMAHANWRLDNPPVVDVAVSRRMGLFVVARLAARHGIRVGLPRWCGCPTK